MRRAKSDPPEKFKIMKVASDGERSDETET